jgi:hypothetical protein
MNSSIDASFAFSMEFAAIHDRSEKGGNIRRGVASPSLSEGQDGGFLKVFCLPARQNFHQSLPPSTYVSTCLPIRLICIPAPKDKGFINLSNGAPGGHPLSEISEATACLVFGLPGKANAFGSKSWPLFVSLSSSPSYSLYSLIALPTVCSIKFWSWSNVPL